VLGNLKSIQQSHLCHILVSLRLRLLLESWNGIEARSRLRVFENRVLKRIFGSKKK
jgi:hypothetical protein